VDFPWRVQSRRLCTHIPKAAFQPHDGRRARDDDGASGEAKAKTAISPCSPSRYEAGQPTSEQMRIIGIAIADFDFAPPLLGRADEVIEEPRSPLRPMA
jgi:hypothetical protein